MRGCIKKAHEGNKSAH